MEATKLAIIIPAYKKDFLENTLKSLANQSCKRFNLYVGDDASPHGLRNIIDPFVKDLNINYTIFDENLGGTDLVHHWNRCFHLIQNEEWVWFFSDDDLLDPECVKHFYEEIEENIYEDVIHFNLKVIDENDLEIFSPNPFPKTITSEKFYQLLYSKKISARMPEFIFRSSKFKQAKLFEKFDLAWRTDNATVMKVGYPNGIRTISRKKDFVYWRYSLNNISRINTFVKRKDKATIEFFNWAYYFFQQNKINNSLNTLRQVSAIVFNLSLTNNKNNFLKTILQNLNSFLFIKTGYAKTLYLLIAIYRVLLKK